MRNYRVDFSKYPSVEDIEKKEVSLILKIKRKKELKKVVIGMSYIKDNIYEANVKKTLKPNEIFYLINNEIEIEKKKRQKALKLDNPFCLINNEIEKKNDLDNRIAIVSTMSSGKSTLINALLGRDILPSENQACTGKIFEISNFKNKKEKIQILKSGEILSENTESLNSEYLKAVNSEEKVDKVKINTKFPSIEREVVLYDTPGVNNFMNNTHGEITYEFLKTNSIKNIIYILNVTQIGVTDDKKFLLDLKEIYKKNKANIIFLLNKIDTIDSEYEDREVIIKNAENYLENIGFENPKLIAISAHIAKILRKGIKNELETRKEKMEFKTYVEEYIQKNNLKYKDKTVNEKLINRILKETGIQELELLINQGKI